MQIDWALQEWAMVVDALLVGDCHTIARKGGIHEPRGDFFSFRHVPAAIVSTYEHQQRERIRPDLRPNESARQAGSDMVTIRGWISAAQCWKIEDVSCLEALAEHLPFSQLELAQRFHYKEPWLAVIALRVHALDQPVHLPRMKGYGGCRSWLRLDTGLSLAHRPVLSDAQWHEHLALLQSLLSPKP